MISTTTLMRLSTLMLIGLSALVFLGPILDFRSGVVAHILGWINNVSMWWTAAYLLILPIFVIHMRGVREYGFLAVIIALFSWTFWYTAQTTQDMLISIGGLVALAGAVAAGIQGYILARSGQGLQGRIVFAIAITVFALPLAPTFVSLTPDAFENYWAKVYGYSNVRVLGYFSAAVIMVLSGLLLHRTTAFRFSLLLAIGIAVGWAVLFWSGSRGGLAAVVIGGLVALAVMRRPSLRGAFLGLGAAGVGIASSSLIPIPDHNFGILSRLARNNEIVSRLSETTQGAAATASQAVKAVSSNRIDLWQWTIDRIMEAPWVGRGYLPMSWMRVEAFNFYHSHNIVLEYALAFGIPMATLVLGISLWAWIRAIGAARRIDTPVATALLFFVCAIPVYANLSATLFFPYHLMLFMICLGTLIGWDAVRRAPDQQAESTPSRFRPEADWMFDEV